MDVDICEVVAFNRGRRERSRPARPLRETDGFDPGHATKGYII